MTIHSNKFRTVNENIKLRVPERYKKEFLWETEPNEKMVLIDYLGYLEFCDIQDKFRDKESGIPEDFSNFSVKETFINLPELNVKNVSKIRGHEGEPCWQCNVYYKGKLIGFYNGYESYSGCELSYEKLDKDFLDNDNGDEFDMILTFEKNDKNFQIKEFEFKNYIQTLCEMKKIYKMIK